MPVWDDFVVAPWRNQFESLNDVRAVKPDLMVGRIWRQRISVQGFADSDGNPSEGGGDDRRAHTEISAHADHDQPHPVLGNSEVGHVDDLRAKVVTYGRATLLLASKACRGAQCVPDESPGSPSIRREKAATFSSTNPAGRSVSR